MTLYAIKNKKNDRYVYDGYCMTYNLELAKFFNDEKSAKEYIKVFELKNVKPVPVEIKKLPEEEEKEVESEK